jgi:hypothetical protein
MAKAINQVGFEGTGIALVTLFAVASLRRSAVGDGRGGIERRSLPAAALLGQPGTKPVSLTPVMALAVAKVHVAPPRLAGRGAASPAAALAAKSGNERH